MLNCNSKKDSKDAICVSSPSFINYDCCCSYFLSAFPFKKIAPAAKMTIKMTEPIIPAYLTILPKIIPTAKKSVSENVVVAKPKSPKKGINNNGKNVINIPFKAAPATAPLIPPRALPKTADVAPRKSVQQHLVI